MATHPYDAIPAIYDAAVDMDAWHFALDRASSIVGARGAMLIAVERGGDIPFHIQMVSELWRTVSPDLVKYYMQNLSHYEKDAWEFIETIPKHRLYPDNEFWGIDDEELRERPDYKYNLEHFGILRKTFARLNDNPSWFDSIVFQFNPSLPVIPNEYNNAISALIPHLSKAVEIGRSFSILKSRYQAVLSALDFIEIGICLVLKNQTVIVKNTEAIRILDFADGIVLADNARLKVSDNKQNALLAEAITSAATTSIGQGNTAEVLLTINRNASAHPLLVEVSPIRDSDEEIEKHLSGAMVTLIDPDNYTVFSTRRVAEVFGLTEAEGSVCRYLVDGWSNPDIAEDRNVSIETIKSQVSSIMAKTNTRKRSELIRIALQTSPPITRLVPD